MALNRTDLNGLLLVDKPTDCTSHDVVARARRIFQMRSIGHSGTLDPLASGLMVLLMGEGTKLSDYILSENKRYKLKLKLGLTTDTLDITGQTLTTTPVAMTEEEFRSALQSMVGSLQLPVPMFSAVKIQGQKMYEYARKNEAVTAPIKEMNFFDMQVVSLELPEAEIEISCSKGSYIRAWIHELGQKLGCGAVMTELRRLRSEPFSIENAVRLESLENQTSLAGYPEAFIGLAEALPTWKAIRIQGREQALLRNGQIAKDLAARLILEQKQALSTGKTVGIRVLDTNSRLLALLEATTDKGLRIRRVFVDDSSH